MKTKAKQLLEAISSDLDRMVKHYVVTMLWASTDDDGEPLDKSYNLQDVSAEALKEIKKDCQEFIKKAEKLIDEDEKLGGDYSRAGHDFFLTRNGHGAGFWDGDWSNGDELTKIAKSFGEMNPFPNDDGTIELM